MSNATVITEAQLEAMRAKVATLPLFFPDLPAHATKGLLADVGVPARGHASADREAQVESTQHPASSSLAQHAAGQRCFGWC